MTQLRLRMVQTHVRSPCHTQQATLGVSHITGRTTTDPFASWAATQHAHVPYLNAAVQTTCDHLAASAV